MIDLISAPDAFTNPDSPWYYVVGVVFLLLIFGAFAVYLVISGKRKRAKEEKKNNESVAEPTAENTEETDEAATESAPNSEKDRFATEGSVPQDAIGVEEAVSEPESIETAVDAETTAEETKPAEKDVEDSETAAQDEQVSAENAEKPKEMKTDMKETEKISENAPVAGSKKEGTKGIAQTTKTKKAVKPFIDRLIAAKDMHGVYNELKNTILSYPGMKAKLTKENEMFFFGTEKKAAFELEADGIVLKLHIDPSAAPKQLGAQKSNDTELPAKLKVTPEKIDSAQKLIVFAMNIALLTRNEKHRRVDYVKNAINAKAKAKKK